ncbi:EamA/RhaT family transporter, partial [Pseudomonas chlororaphis]|nr:EamA/RhaT family transporter [Pseudomonas chlororaphis]
GQSPASGWLLVPALLIIAGAVLATSGARSAQG